MLDIKLIRKDPKKVEKLLQRKDKTISLDEILALDTQIREVITEVESLQAKRNAISKQIGEKKRRGEETSSLMNEVGEFGNQTEMLGHRRAELEKRLHDALALLPNIPDEDIRISYDPADNVCLKTWGQKREFDFPFKNHVEIGEHLNLFDFKRAAKTSGSRWPAYCNIGARLEWALINYMLDIHIENGFEFWMPPLLVKPDVVFGSGNLPKFESQLFKIKDDDYQLYLIPTAEAVLNGLHKDEIFPAGALPKRYVAYTPCFRREAGAAGAEERGLIRTHQFNKVEMFAFTLPEQAPPFFDQMVKSVEEILEGLRLHYRIMLLVTGDMSFAAKKTIDVEVWVPGQKRFYEVSSISDCGTFQAHRSQIRYKQKEDKPEFVHTLNGSGVATSRLMAALLENNQQKDGSVEIPLVLHKYLNGMTRIPSPSYV